MTHILLNNLAVVRLPAVTFADAQLRYHYDYALAADRLNGSTPYL